MIVDTPKEDYLELFEKKFRGFCERAPIYLTFSIVYNEVHIKEVNTNENFAFEIDESVPVEDFIGTIRRYLKENVYPRLIEEKSSIVEPSVEDLLNYTQTNKSFDEAYAILSKKVKEIEYVVDKINIRKNQLVLEKLESGEQYLFQLHMPVVLFLRNEIRKHHDPKEAFLSLKREGEFLYKIERKK